MDSSEECTYSPAVKTTDAKRMAKTTFADLSVDIKSLIVDEILRPTDLRNVCLVNKQFHEIAVKQLYHDVDLDIGSSNDHHVISMLSTKNIGLKYIRSIHLYLADERETRNKTTEQAHLVTATILQFLPEDILERFSWCPWKAFKTENLLLLYKRQRKMKTLEVISLTEELLPKLEKESQQVQDDIFSSATRLFLYPENRSTLKDCGHYVKKTAAKLEELTIHANFNSNPDPFDPLVSAGHVEQRELNDSATQPGLLTRSIFGHLIPFDKCEPLANIRSICLHRVSVRHAADTWTKAFDFKKIEFLHLHECSGSDSFLAQLSKAAHMPRLLKVFDLQHIDNAENETLAMLDGFLCLVSGITDLILELRAVRALPAAAGIARHGKTLELLSVHAAREDPSGLMPSPPPPPPGIAMEDEIVYRHDDIETITKACTGLVQLSCAWPQTNIVRPPSDEWRHFEAWILYKMPKLVTLNISSWPMYNPNGPAPHRIIYETLLQALALRLFNIASFLKGNPDMPAASEFIQTWVPPSETCKTPKLRLIAFGVSDKIYERMDSKSQIIYLRSTCKDAEARERLHATPIGWCMKQYVESASGVLDFALLRTPKPPFPGSMVRDRGLGGWDPEEDDGDDV